MGEAKRRGSREQRVEMAQEHEAFLKRQQELIEEETRRLHAEMEARLPPEVREQRRQQRHDQNMRRAQAAGMMVGLMGMHAGALLRQMTSSAMLADLTKAAKTPQTLPIEGWMKHNTDPIDNEE